MNRITDMEKYKRSSRRAAWIALAAFVVVMTAIAWNAFRLHAIDAEIAEQEVLVEQRLQTVAGLEEEVARLTYAPELRPNAHAEEIPDIKDHMGRQMYDFMLWVDRAAFRDREIAEVTWMSDSRMLREVTSSDRTNGFGVTYRGTECLGAVRAALRYSDGSREDMDFDMCAALGW